MALIAIGHAVAAPARWAEPSPTRRVERAQSRSSRASPAKSTQACCRSAFSGTPVALELDAQQVELALRDRDRIVGCGSRVVLDAVEVGDAAQREEAGAQQYVGLRRCAEYRDRGNDGSRVEHAARRRQPVAFRVRRTEEHQRRLCRVALLDVDEPRSPKARTGRRRCGRSSGCFGSASTVRPATAATRRAPPASRPAPHGG